MKKLILISLCVLFVANTAALAESYTVSGKVYYKGTTTTVPSAVVTITMTCDTGSASGSTTTDNQGNYSTGWTDCGTCGCVGNQMTLRATKSVYAGGVTWTAQSSSETKDIYISSTVQINPDLAVGTIPAHFANPGMQIDNNLAYAYDETPGTTPIEVTHFNAQLAYDSSKMMCLDVMPAPQFSDGFGFDNSVLGIVTVSADSTGGTSVLLGDVNEPTGLFSLIWDVPETDPASKTSVIFDDELSEFTTLSGPNNPVLNRTDYTIGEMDPHSSFLLDSQVEWEDALMDKHVRPMGEEEWNHHLDTINNYMEPGGEAYPPDTEFLPAELWVYEGNPGSSDPLDPCDGGLVMAWGDYNTPDGNYASAWKYDYAGDPDLRNSTIQVTVTAPQFGMAGVQINTVCFGITDIAGLKRIWTWQVGNPPKPIQWNTPTTITINTAMTGVNATTPTASSYASAPLFNLAKSMSFDVDENAAWIFQSVPVPPPGQPTFVGMWNYWHNLLVTRNIAGHANSKWYIKYSQPPVVIDANDPPIITGWDELSDYNSPPIWADDWPCKDDRPITDVHWWGSFIGWTQPHPPPILPKAFHIGIWTNVPDDPLNPDDYSHPDKMVWENYCDNWVWNFAGYDRDPFDRPERENEACFQFNQLLSEDEWFLQEPNEAEPNNVYWLSIAAVYNASDYTDPDFYPWGWKTRPHKFEDDACSILALADASWPPKKGSIWINGNPLKGPEGETWDLAFELTTNDHGNAIADLNGDGIINFFDFAFLADYWLMAP